MVPARLAQLPGGFRAGLGRPLGPQTGSAHPRAMAVPLPSRHGRRLLSLDCANRASGLAAEFH